MGTSKYDLYKAEIDAMLNSGKMPLEISQTIKAKYALSETIEGIRNYVKVRQTTLKYAENHPALAEECNTAGIPIQDVNHYWYKGENFSIFVKDKKIGIEDVMGDILKEIREYAPKYAKIKYAKPKESFLQVINPADIHIGKLASAYETGDEYNAQIAVDRVISGVESVLSKASGYKFDKTLLVLGNDILHVDNAKSSTTANTFQDSHLMWYDAFNTAVRLMRDVIEMIIPTSPIHIHFNPSNHDYTTGFFLAQTLKAWFHACPHITFDVSPSHRKYFNYGKNLIGSTHGDGAKTTDLGALMAHEASLYWHECIYRYWYECHIHHKRSKDFMSVNVESMGSASGTDSWHHRNGYQHAPKTIESFIHNKEFGRIARFTHIF